MLLATLAISRPRFVRSLGTVGSLGSLPTGQEGEVTSTLLCLCLSRGSRAIASRRGTPKPSTDFAVMSDDPAKPLAARLLGPAAKHLSEHLKCVLPHNRTTSSWYDTAQSGAESGFAGLRDTIVPVRGLKSLRKPARVCA